MLLCLLHALFDASIYIANIICINNLKVIAMSNQYLFILLLNCYGMIVHAGKVNIVPVSYILPFSCALAACICNRNYMKL